MKNRVLSLILMLSVILSQSCVLAETVGEETINNAEDFVKLIEDLGKSGILENGQKGYDGFKALSSANKYYTNGISDTNFHEIFQSESDMRGLQMLVDKVLDEKAYREY